MAKGTCTAPDCEDPAAKREWCNKHYQRWWKHGDPEKRLRIRYSGTAAERFWAWVDKRGPDECWNWTGATMHGYGRFNVGGGKIIGAHRFAYELLVGPVPEGLELDHLCRNPACVNPTHLEPVTHLENVDRGEMRQRLRESVAARTHCKRNHPWDEANTYWWRGKRQCRACQRLMKQARSRP